MINTLALLVVEYVIPGFELVDLRAAVVAAIMIGVVNTFIRPILQIIFLPLSILTLGVVAFLINVVLLWGVAMFVPGFEIISFTTAAIASIALSLINAFLHRMAKRREKRE